MRISVTQLETFQQCQVKYDYRHRRHLRPNDVKESAALSVGRQVADALEAGLLSDSPRAVAMSKSSDPRVMRTLAVMPDDIWALGKAAVAENKLEVEVGRHTLVGMPDLWYVEYASATYHDDYNTEETTEAVGVHVVEFKTTGDPKSKATEKAIRYEDWGEQATRYAALLWKQYEWLRYVPFYRRHILLSWHEKANLAYPGRRLLVSGRAIGTSLAEMERIADDAERVYEGGGKVEYWEEPVGPVHHYSTLCSWCEFGPICQANLRSGDTEWVIETAYTQKEER